MAIKRPEELDFSAKKFTLIIAGPPGVGKTTVALSAPDSLLYDLDKGIARVRAEHRGLSCEDETYEELLEDMNTPEYRAAQSIVLDTGGSLIQLMQPWAKKQDSKAARDGRAMFGIIKREFDRLLAQIRADRKNVIILFHTTEVQKNDTITQRLSCEGSAKDIVWTPADLGGYMHIMGGKRLIGFTPTEEYFAKSCYGIGGLVEVPELKPGQKNDFLARLFEKAKSNIIKEMEVFKPQKEAYDAAMDETRALMANVETVEDLNAAVKQMQNIQHALTSRQEALNMVGEKAKALGASYDKGAKQYVAA